MYFIQAPKNLFEADGQLVGPLDTNSNIQLVREEVKSPVSYEGTNLFIGKIFNLPYIIFFRVRATHRVGSRL
jgi:hypothetical protein